MTAKLDTEICSKIIQKISVNDPDFVNFQAALIESQGITKSIPDEILRGTVDYLEAESDYGPIVYKLSSNPEHLSGFATGTEIATFVAIAFLLRTHIKIKRGGTGKWEILVEHKPGDSKLLTSILKKISMWIDG